MATFERADVFEVEQVGIETTLLSAAVATKKFTGTSIVNEIMTDVQDFSARGSRFSNVAIENKEWTEATWTGDIATYTEPAYALAAAFGAADITTPGGGTLSRDWVTAPPTFAGVNPKSLTLESANFVRAGKSAGHTVDTIGFDFARDSVKWHAHSFGGLLTDAITPTPGTNEVQTITKSGTVSGGTWTITFYGNTTGVIQWNDNAATIQTALEALPNVGVGGIAVTGGPVSSTPVVLTFKLQWASQNVPMVIIDYSLITGGGTIAPAETTPGASLTEIALQPVAGNQWNLYVDSSAAGLGGTKLTRALSVSWEVNTLWGPLWVGNTANTAWVNVVPLKPTTTFKFVLEADAVGMGYLTQMRAGTRIFPRIEAIGALIEGALYYRWLQDFCVFIKQVKSFGVDQGIVTNEYTGVIAHDPTWAKALNIAQRWTGTAL